MQKYEIPQDLSIWLCYIELFAGTARLLRAVGIFLDVMPDDPLTVGGTDFREPEQVQALQERCRLLVVEGASLYFHVAPPCATSAGRETEAHALA